MDIFNLGHILNALGFNKKIEPSAKVQKNSQAGGAASSSSTPAEDSVSISQEAVVKSSLESISRELKLQTEQVREDRVAEIKEKIDQGQYQVAPQNVSEKITQGPDIYEDLK